MEVKIVSNTLEKEISFGKTSVTLFLLKVS